MKKILSFLLVLSCSHIRAQMLNFDDFNDFFGSLDSQLNMLRPQNTPTQVRTTLAWLNWGNAERSTRAPVMNVPQREEVTQNSGNLWANQNIITAPVVNNNQNVNNPLNFESTLPVLTTQQPQISENNQNLLQNNQNLLQNIQNQVTLPQINQNTVSGQQITTTTLPDWLNQLILAAQTTQPPPLFENTLQEWINQLISTTQMTQPQNPSQNNQNQVTLPQINQNNVNNQQITSSTLPDWINQLVNQAQTTQQPSVIQTTPNLFNTNIPLTQTPSIQVTQPIFTAPVVQTTQTPMIITQLPIINPNLRSEVTQSPLTVQPVEILPDWVNQMISEAQINQNNVNNQQITSSTLPDWINQLINQARTTQQQLTSPTSIPVVTQPSVLQNTQNPLINQQTVSQINQNTLPDWINQLLSASTTTQRSIVTQNNQNQVTLPQIIQNIVNNQQVTASTLPDWINQLILAAQTTQQPSFIQTTQNPWIQNFLTTMSQSLPTAPVIHNTFVPMMTTNSNQNTLPDWINQLLSSTTSQSQQVTGSTLPDWILQLISTTQSTQNPQFTTPQPQFTAPVVRNTTNSSNTRIPSWINPAFTAPLITRSTHRATKPTRTVKNNFTTIKPAIVKATTMKSPVRNQQQQQQQFNNIFRMTDSIFAQINDHISQTFAQLGRQKSLFNVK